MSTKQPYRRFAIKKWHAFSLEKDLGYSEFYQDAWSVDELGLRAAVADGVSEGFASGDWARLLTQAALSRPPVGMGLHEWLTPIRAEFDEILAQKKLGFFQRQKLKEVGGGYSTLLFIQIGPSETTGNQEVQSEYNNSKQDSEHDDEDSAQELSGGGTKEPDEQLPISVSNEYKCMAWSVGDCCLFLIREGKLLASFPATSSADFGLDPDSLSSADYGRKGLPEVNQEAFDCREGDVLVLVSDALAEWLFLQIERGNEPTWDSYVTAGHDEWVEHIQTLRDRDEIRCDDTTLIAGQLLTQMCDGADVATDSCQQQDSIAAALDKQGEDVGADKVSDHADAILSNEQNSDEDHPME